MSTGFNFDLKDFPEARVSKLLELGSLEKKDLRDEANKRLFCKFEINFSEQSYLIPKAGMVAEPMAENRDVKSEAWSEFKKIVNNLYAEQKIRVATLQLVNQLSTALETE